MQSINFESNYLVSNYSRSKMLRFIITWLNDSAFVRTGLTRSIYLEENFEISSLSIFLVFSKFSTPNNSFSSAELAKYNFECHLLSSIMCELVTKFIS